MRLPERKDFLDYAESAAGQELEVQKRILQLLASSSAMREQLAELKRDLYLVSAQVPEYMPETTFGPELVRLSQTWIRLVYMRKFSLQNFYRSREFFGLLLVLVGVTLLLLALLGPQLLR